MLQVNELIEGRCAGEWSVSRGSHTHTKTHIQRQWREDWGICWSSATAIINSPFMKVIVFSLCLKYFRDVLIQLLLTLEAVVYNELFLGSVDSCSYKWGGQIVITPIEVEVQGH